MVYQGDSTLIIGPIDCKNKLVQRGTHYTPTERFDPCGLCCQYTFIFKRVCANVMCVGGVWVNLNVCHQDHEGFAVAFICSKVNENINF